MIRPNSRVFSFLALLTFVVAPLRAADALTFTIQPTPSTISLVADVSVLGGALTSSAQCTGCLTTRYDGTIQTTTTGLSSIRFDGGGAADARQQLGVLNIPRAIAPGVGGAAGTAPADYGVTFSAPIGTVLPPITIPNVGTLNLGTLQSIDVKVAARNVVLDVTSTSFLPVAAGAFDASQTNVLLSGNLDISTLLVLRAPDLTSYFTNLVALGALALAVPDLGLIISGNLLTRDISIGLGFGVPLTAVPLANAATAGSLTAVGNLATLTLPIDVSATPSNITGVFGLDIGLQGNLVATATIPEPTTALLLCLGLAGLARMGRARA